MMMTPNLQMDHLPKAFISVRTWECNGEGRKGFRFKNPGLVLRAHRNCDPSSLVSIKRNDCAYCRAIVLDTAAPHSKSTRAQSASAHTATVDTLQDPRVQNSHSFPLA